MPRLDFDNIILQYYVIMLHPIVHEKNQQLIGEEQSQHCLHLFMSRTSSFLKYTRRKKYKQLLMHLNAESLLHKREPVNFCTMCLS